MSRNWSTIKSKGRKKVQGEESAMKTRNRKKKGWVCEMTRLTKSDDLSKCESPTVLPGS